MGRSGTMVVAVFAIGLSMVVAGTGARPVDAQPGARDGIGDPEPARWPVDGDVLRPFEPPPNPYAAGHRGVDLGAEPGDLVRAALAGTVTFAGRVAGKGWVTVDHGGGLQTTYGDLEPTFVRAGRAVRSGEPLGRLARGAPHLDWGARLDGGYIDPLSLLARWEIYLVPVS